MEAFFVLCAIFCFITAGAPSSSGPEGVVGEDAQNIWADQGSNLTLPCGASGLRVKDVMWIREGRKDHMRNRVLDDGSIVFTSMQQSDSGIYECRIELDSSAESPERETLLPSSSMDIYYQQQTTSTTRSRPKTRSESASPYEARFQIRVRTPPPLLKNVTVTPFTILALVSWELEKEGDGGYPIRSFQIAYRLKNATENDWKTCLPAYIDPLYRSHYVYNLQPNSAYLFKVWGNNQLGRGVGSVVEAFTQNDPQEIEYGKHLLDGVDSFDVRIWIIAVGIVISTLIILGVATCCLFYKEYNMNLATDSGDADGESIELMPNIILNPGYDFPSIDGLLPEPDENLNDTAPPRRINNNSVIHPTRV